MAGCSNSADPSPGSTASEPPTPSTTSTTEQFSTIPERLLIDLDADVVERVISVAARELELDVIDLEPVVAVAVTWGNDSLNCPRSDEAATEVATDGFWIVLTDGRRIYDYRAGEDGVFRACENGGPPATTKVGS